MAKRRIRLRGDQMESIEEGPPQSPMEKCEQEVECPDEKVPDEEYLPCFVQILPEELWMPAAQDAVEENPINHPAVEGMDLEPQELAILTSKYWGTKGVDLGVAFMDNPPQSVRSRILSHMNAWGEKGANIKFREAALGSAQVRIARNESAYWSYLGTDILSIGRNQATMMLGRFTDSTTEATYRRVCRHEIGHTLGMPHEHLRRAIVDLLDVEKTLAYFRQTQGWSDSVTRSNVLTPIEDRVLIASEMADVESIMAYMLPASITKNNRPIPGGNDINDRDYDFVNKAHPGVVVPPPPPPPGSGLKMTLSAAIPAGSYLLIRE